MGDAIAAESEQLMSTRPWLAAYDPGVPAEIEPPDEPLHAALSAAELRFPARAAIRFFGRAVTYRQLESAANRFANALVALGLHKGDRVALPMPNCPQLVIAYYGALKAGAVVVPTSPLYVESELEHQLADAEATVVVCLSALFGKVQAVRPRLPSLQHVRSAARR